MKFDFNKLGLAAKICVMVTTIVFGIATVGESILLNNADAVNSALGIQTEKVIESEDSEDKDKFYYKSAFTSVAGVRANGEAYCEAVMREGATLLKNAQLSDGSPALPLAEDAKVSLFGISSVDHFTEGNGSSTWGARSSVSFKEGLEAAGMTVNEKLWTWYENNQSTYGRKSNGQSVGGFYSIGDAAWSEVNTDAKTDSTYGDAAIFVLARAGGEGVDLCQWYGNELSKSIGGASDDMTNGDYLTLNAKEKDVLKNLKKEKDKGTFKRIVVIMNAANPVECDFVDDPEYGIDALMWVGTTGETGTRSVGKLLNGKYNPSGRLPDTFYKYNTSSPANANFGMNSEKTTAYTQYTDHTGNVFASNAYNTVYQEGIYVGYRYTETRYEDTVLKDKQNVGAFEYYDNVSYPFGYGLSYTSFEYSDFDVTYNAATSKDEESTYEITVKVTNTGDVDGKEAVQIYLQKPYTAYDRTNGIEKASVELVGYAKTDILEKNGGSQTLTVSVNERELASYDAKGAGTYIVDGGTYYFTAGRDAHDAVNNILTAKGKTTGDGMTAGGNGALVKSFEKTFDDSDNIDRETYSASKNTKNKITNQFEKADLKYYEGAADFEYVTRSNWAGTLAFFERDNTGKRKFTGVDVKAIGAGKSESTSAASAQMAADRRASLADPEPDAEKKEYPKYGVNNDLNAEGHLNLINLRSYGDDDNDPTNDELIPYEHELWDRLLDQLTWDETVELLSHGWRLTYGIPSIAKPQTKDHNGSNGPITNYNSDNTRGFAVLYNDPDAAKTPVVYPCNGLIAATFNKELAEFYGKQWGEDGIWAGYSGLYGMGLNTHRSAYGGRNFEYYSEDPVLGGTQAAQMVKGMATRGMYVYLKHCVLNDQETYRCGVYTWANEQTIREIYLKSFQIAIEDGGAQCVMTSFSCLGLEWSGSQGFVNNVLRREFGMTGHAVTDFYWDVRGNAMKGILAGNDIPDGNYETDGYEAAFFAKAAPLSEGGTGNYASFAWEMRECAHRILYTVVHSNAMNGFDSSTKILRLTPWWKPTVAAIRITFTVLFALSLAAALAAIIVPPVLRAVNKKKEQKEVKNEKVD